MIFMIFPKLTCDLQSQSFIEELFSPLHGRNLWSFCWFCLIGSGERGIDLVLWSVNWLRRLESGWLMLSRNLLGLIKVS
jgi:hypothetical protein